MLYRYAIPEQNNLILGTWIRLSRIYRWLGNLGADASLYLICTIPSFRNGSPLLFIFQPLTEFCLDRNNKGMEWWARRGTSICNERRLVGALLYLSARDFLNTYFETFRRQSKMADSCYDPVDDDSLHDSRIAESTLEVIFWFTFAWIASQFILWDSSLTFYGSLLKFLKFPCLQGFYSTTRGEVEPPSHFAGKLFSLYIL